MSDKETYKYIQLLESQDLFNVLVKKGIIPVTLAAHKLIYEWYLKEKNKGIGTSQAVTNTSIETKTPESTVYRIIKKMKS